GRGRPRLRGRPRRSPLRALRGGELHSRARIPLHVVRCPRGGVCNRGAPRGDRPPTAWPSVVARAGGPARGPGRGAPLPARRRLPRAAGRHLDGGRPPPPPPAPPPRPGRGRPRPRRPDAVHPPPRAPPRPPPA